MATQREGGPYIWPTWLSKILAGENMCEWAAWFRAQHDGRSWERVPSTGNLARWQLEHTEMLRNCADNYLQQGWDIALEGQNSFSLRGQAATVAGKPDLVVRKDETIRIIDTKSGRPKASDQIQVMIYMYLLPLARPEYKGKKPEGLIVYQDDEVELNPAEVNEKFADTFRKLVQRIGDRNNPAIRVPSQSECQFCDISSADCPARMETTPEGSTDLF